MKYIERITKDEFNEALKAAYEILPVEEFWDVRGIVVEDWDICWATKDKSCYYLYQTKEENFAYFALEKKVQNIKGLYETMLDLVYSGIPYVHFNGKKGRYDIIKKGFYQVFDDDKYDKRDDWDYLVVYAAYPENVLKLINKINRGDK